MKLAELAADADTLTLDEFRARHGSAFLVGIEGSLKQPTRFEETRARPASPVPATAKAIEWFVIPVRKRERSLSIHRISVGRTQNNDVPVEDPSVSRLHAFFEPPVAPAVHWTVRDAGSRTGTHVNRVPAKEPTEVRSGYEVQLGDVYFTFMAAEMLVSFAKQMTKPRT